MSECTILEPWTNKDRVEIVPDGSTTPDAALSREAKPDNESYLDKDDEITIVDGKGSTNLKTGVFTPNTINDSPIPK